VAYGILRMDRALRAFLNAFYHVHGSSASRNDFTLFQIIGYIGLFRMSEVGFSRFIGLLSSQVCERSVQAEYTGTAASLKGVLPCRS
jgi:hypothetical protein